MMVMVSLNVFPISQVDHVDDESVNVFPLSHVDHVDDGPGYL